MPDKLVLSCVQYDLVKKVQYTVKELYLKQRNKSIRRCDCVLYTSLIDNKQCKHSFYLEVSISKES